MKFVLGGEEYELSREDVERAMRGVEPEIGRQHFVEVNEKEYPVKQVFALSLRKSRLDFNTMQARSILRRLGFRVIER